MKWIESENLRRNVEPQLITPDQVEIAVMDTRYCPHSQGTGEIDERELDICIRYSNQNIPTPDLCSHGIARHTYREEFSINGSWSNSKFFLLRFMFCFCFSFCFIPIHFFVRRREHGKWSHEIHFIWWSEGERRKKTKNQNYEKMTEKLNAILSITLLFIRWIWIISWERHKWIAISGELMRFLQSSFFFFFVSSWMIRMNCIFNWIRYMFVVFICCWPDNDIFMMIERRTMSKTLQCLLAFLNSATDNQIAPIRLHHLCKQILCGKDRNYHPNRVEKIQLNVMFRNFLHHSWLVRNRGMQNTRNISKILALYAHIRTYASAREWDKRWMWCAAHANVHNEL